MKLVQCMSLDGHWRPGGALCAPKIPFKADMVMIGDIFFL
jgi:hypothetical protein